MVSFTWSGSQLLTQVHKSVQPPCSVMMRKKRKSHLKSPALQKVNLSTLYLMSLTFQMEDLQIALRVPQLCIVQRNLAYTPATSQLISRSRAGVLLELEAKVPCTTLLARIAPLRILSLLFLSYQNICQAIRPEDNQKSASPRNPIHTVTAYWDMNTVSCCTGELESLAEARVGHAVSCHSTFACAILST